MSSAAQAAPSAPSFYQQAIAWLKQAVTNVETAAVADWDAIAPTVLADAESIFSAFLGTAVNAAVAAATAGLTGQEHFSQVKTQVLQAIEASGKTAQNSVVNDVVSVGTTLAGLVTGQLSGGTQQATGG